MRIVDNKRTNWKILVDCLSCSSILQVEEQDVKLYFSEISRNSNYYVNCGACDGYISVTDKVPWFIKSNCLSEK